MTSVSKRQQKQVNAHLEHLAREVEVVASRKGLEIMSLRRIDDQTFNQKFKAEKKEGPSTLL